jgi:uncharacterized protein (TIGR02680 family)
MAKAADQFLKSAGHLILLNEEIAEAERKHREARSAVERIKQRQQALALQLSVKRSEFESTRDSHWQSVLAWFGRAAILHDYLPPIGDWFDQWHHWAEAVSQNDPSTIIVQAAHNKSIAVFASRQSRLKNDVEELDSNKGSLIGEQRRLESGAAIEPAPRPNRDSTNREKLGGAPFWKLVEFHPGIPPSERGNWEAALEDSGLLDAWLTADGRLLTADSGANAITEIQLAEHGLAPLEESRQLSRVLRFADESASVEKQTVDRILNVIGIGADAGPTWVGRDGRWQNGPLHGCWTKPEPQFVGEESRAKWRQIRLLAIRDELGEIKNQRQEVERELAAIEQDRQSVSILGAEFPNSQPLLRLDIEVGLLHQDEARVADELRTSQQIESECVGDVEEKTARRDIDATDFGLSSWTTRAMDLQSRLQDYLGKLQTLEARVDSLRSAIGHVSAARDSRDRSMTAEKQAQHRLDAVQIELGECRERVRAIEETAGQGVSQILEKLALKRSNKESLDSLLQQNDAEIGSVKTELAVDKSKLDQKKLEADQTDDLRRAATHGFSSLHSCKMVEMIVNAEEIPQIPWSMTQAIRLARRMDSLLEGEPIDDESWQSSQNQIHQAQYALQPTILSQDGMSIDVAHLQDGLQQVTLTLQGERLSPVSAVARLETEITNRERILDEREQETLEKYLLGEVADGLRHGMREAAGMIESMTHEVSKRPMKSGMQMRFKWRRDEEGPEGLADACEILASSSATWSPQEREQIKQFLQRSIRRQRETEETGSWHDHLRAALDYRQWHRIVIERRSGPDANWLRLTRRTYASGSGGEKAIGLTLPQLAAAAAYYETADRHAPRFILLDEAFAGISPDMRESCMELIASFRLDVVMTSEIEWGCYPGVPQLAICQLDRFSEYNAVVNRVFVWNGLQKRIATSREEQAAITRQPLFQEE